MLTHTDLPLTDAIEIANTSGAPLDVSGWFLTDSKSNYQKFRIPDETTIPTGGYLVFDESDFNPPVAPPAPEQGFRLSSSLGEDVFLMEADAAGNLLAFVDRVSFPAALNGESFGRWPDLTGDLYPMVSRTFGAANAGPRVGPTLISEVHYHPTGMPEVDLEFVELYNPTGTVVDLANWTLRGAADFDFGPSLIPAGGVVVIVGFAPGDTVRRNAFESAYGVDYPVTYIGPWDPGDLLDNAPGGTVRLRRADDPPAEDPTLFPQVIEDEVKYLTTSPWPPAGGTGSSLNRIGTTSYGNFAASWTAATPTPGIVATSGFAAWATMTGGSTVPGADTDLDGIADVLEYPLGLNPVVPDVDQLAGLVYDGSNITLTFPRDTTITDVTVTGEISPDLFDWTPVGDTLASQSGTIEMRQITVPVDDGARYIRLRAQ